MFRFHPNHTNSLQIYQLLRYAATIIISIIFAKSYFSTDEIGIYESFLFFFSLFSFFWIGTIQSLLSLEGKYSNSSYKRKLIFSSFVAILLISFVLSAISLFFAPLFFPAAENQLKFYFYIYLFLLPSGFLSEYILLLFKKYKAILIFGLFNFLFQITFIAILPVFISFQYIFTGLVLFAIIKFSFAVFLLIKFSKLNFEKFIYIELLKSAWPLFITAILSSSAVYIDSFLIKFKYDNSVFALFRYGAKEIPVFLLIATAFSNAMLNRFGNTQSINNSLAEIKKKSERMFRLFIPFSIILLLSSQYLYPIIFSKAFTESYKIFDIYLLLVVSRFIFPQTILMGMQLNKLVLKAGTIELLINVISSIILLQYFGIVGVAFGTIIAYYCDKFLLAVFLKQKAGVKIEQYLSLKKWLIYSVTLWSFYLLKILLIK